MLPEQLGNFSVLNLLDYSAHFTLMITSFCRKLLTLLASMTPRYMKPVSHVKTVSHAPVYEE